MSWRCHGQNYAKLVSNLQSERPLFPSPLYLSPSPLLQSLCKGSDFWWCGHFGIKQWNQAKKSFWVDLLLDRELDLAPKFDKICVFSSDDDARTFSFFVISFVRWKFKFF
jgi:hypothetical protein